MLTREDLSLLRVAIAYWSEENLSHALPTNEAMEEARVKHLETAPTVVEHLFNRLAEFNVRYVVVDTVEQHVVNTRLFVRPPTISPANGRWQVRSVIG
jgi:hypothetical protein